MTMQSWTLEQYISVIVAQLVSCVKRGNVECAYQYTRQLHRLGLRALREGNKAAL